MHTNASSLTCSLLVTSAHITAVNLLLQNTFFKRENKKMQIIFEADLNKMTEELQELSPERFLRILAVAVKNMAKRNAHEAGKGGKSFWQRVYCLPGFARAL